MKVKKSAPKKRTIRAIRAELKRRLKELAATRDALRALEYELQDQGDTASESAELLEQAIESLSGLV